MATNPFYVEPLGGADIGGTLVGIGGLMQRRQAMEAEAAEREAEESRRVAKEQQTAQAKQAVAQAYRSGDPNQIAEAMATYPEMQKALAGAVGFRNEATKNNMLTSAREILQNPDKAEDILRGRIAFVESQGGDATQTKAELAKLKDDREGFIRGVENSYAGLAPKQEWEAYAQRAGIGPKAQELDIKRETLQLRRDENQARLLEQRLKRETNDLKRDELRLKIDALREKGEQAKRNVLTAAENEVATIDRTMGTVEDLMVHPGLPAAVGRSAMFPTAPGGPAADFESLLKTFDAQAFLSEIPKMKGSGALSDAEGSRLARAVGALNVEMSEPAFKKSLKDIQQTLQSAKSRADKRRKEAESSIEVTETTQTEAALPPTNAQGWQLMTDANGNRAYVGPNGQVQEVP